MAIHENETDEFTFYDVTSYDVIGDVTSVDVMIQHAAVMASWCSIYEVTGANSAPKIKLCHKGSFTIQNSFFIDGI